MTTIRTVLVTGANRGIGFELCRQLRERGWRVWLGARDLAKGEAAAARLGEGVRAVAFDVADPDGATRAARVVGRIDALVNNAGIHYDASQRATTADWRIVREAMETNCFGAWRAIQAFAPGMRDAGWGRIVNVSSEAGSLAQLGPTSPPAYAASKAAMNALTRVAAGELAGSGVLVNSICPGWVATDMGGAGGGPVPEGAASVRWGVELPDDGPTGGFFRHGKRLAW